LILSELYNCAEWSRNYNFLHLTQFYAIKINHNIQTERNIVWSAN